MFIASAKKGDVMKTKLLLASIVLASICGTASAARCVVPFIRTLDNQTVIGTIFTSTGSPCHIGLARSRGPMSSVQLLENAKNGTVRVSGGSIFYVSRCTVVLKESASRLVPAERLAVSLGTNEHCQRNPGEG